MTILSKKKIVFKCSCNFEVGNGHFRRLINYAKIISNNSVDIFFLITNSFDKQIIEIKNNGFIVLEKEPNKCDLLVIDDYLIGHEQETKYRKWARKILVIDDLCKIKHECDILLNPNFGTNKEDYKKLLPEDCKIYTGINYFAFDKDILKFRKKSINKKLRKILVINGFYDKKNIIPSIVNDIFNNCKNVELNIIIGKKKKEILTLKKNNNLNIFINPNEKLHIMKSSDLAFTSSGQTSLELMLLNVPSVIYKVSENQKKNYNFLIKNNLALNVDFKKRNVKEVLNEFLDYQTKAKFLKNNCYNFFKKINHNRILELFHNILELNR